MANGNNISQEIAAEVDVLVNCKIAELREELAKERKDADLRLTEAAVSVDMEIKRLQGIVQARGIRLEQLRERVEELQAQISENAAAK